MIKKNRESWIFEVLSEGIAIMILGMLGFVIIFYFVKIFYKMNNPDTSQHIAGNTTELSPSDKEQIDKISDCIRDNLRYEKTKKTK